MPSELSINVTDRQSGELKSYRVTLPMGTLSIGVDNIHHDVFLSPKFVQVARDYLFDLIRQNTSSTYLSGIEFRHTRPVDSTTFRKFLTELLQSSLTALPPGHPEVHHRRATEPVRQRDPGLQGIHPQARRVF
jgi:hypothetical protein